MKTKIWCALLCTGAIVIMTGSGWAAMGQSAPGKVKAKTVTDAAKPVAKVAQLDQDGLRQALVRDPKAPRPLLLNFWATWCEPCRDEFPDLVKIAKEFGPRGLDFTAVSFDFAEDANTEIPKFLRKVNAQSLPVFWLNVPDPEPSIKMVDPEWGGVIPETFLFDAQGKLVFKHAGRVDAAELRQAIEKELNAK